MAEAKETKKAVEKIDATNPFNKGVTYEAFLKELGTKKIEDFLKGKCTKEEIEWVKTELEHYKNNKK